MRDLLTFDDMFRDLAKFAVGFEPMFQRFDTLSRIDTSFPPYNIEKVDDTHFNLSMAVAGFSKSDIEISIQDGILTIIGDNVNGDDREYLYKGIAGRSFRRSFALNDGLEVTGSELINGMLMIDFVRIQIEISKPKVIPIGSKSSAVEHSMPIDNE